MILTVTFDGNGGESDPASIDYDLGTDICYSPLAVAERENYTFAGWWSTPVGAGSIVTSNTDFLFSVAHSIYARWTVTPIVVVDPIFPTTGDDCDWVAVHAANVHESMPAGLLAAFDAWAFTGATDLLRLARLQTLVTGVVEDFRSASGAAVHPVGLLAEDWIPLLCLRYALAIIFYQVSGDIGYADGVALYAASWSDANVYLRGLYLELRMGNSRFTDESVGGLPLYVTGAGSSSGSGSGDLNALPPGDVVVGGGINWIRGV